MVLTSYTDVTFDNKSESNNFDDDVGNLYQTVTKDPTIATNIEVTVRFLDDYSVLSFFSVLVIFPHHLEDKAKL